MEYKPWILCEYIDNGREVRIRTSNILASPSRAAIWLANQVSLEEYEIIDIGIDKISTED